MKNLLLFYFLTYAVNRERFLKHEVSKQLNWKFFIKSNPKRDMSILNFLFSIE